MVNQELEVLFFADAAPRLRKLEGLLGHLTRSPDDDEVWEKLGDALEFLKAESRQLAFAEWTLVLDSMLSLPRAVREGRLRISPSHLEFLQMLLSYLTALVGNAREEAAALLPKAKIEDLTFRIDAREAFSLRGLSLEELRAGLSAATLGPAEKTENQESVSITLSRLDGLSSRLDGVIVRQFQLKKHLDGLQSLESSLRDLVSDIKAPATDQSSLAGRVDLLLKDVLQLNLGFKEDMTTLDRSAFQFQEELAKFRMVPFEFSEPWEGEVDLEIPPSSTVLDKALLKQVQEPLRELVRNALAHGIEPASQRAALGKPRRGKIRIQCRSDGSSISVEVQDDGRGIDEEAVRNSALALFPMERQELVRMPPAQLFGFLFEAGVTTKTQKTARVSGQGLGLERVKKSVDQLQGRVSVTSTPGKGSTFTLQFPASASLIQGFFVMAGGEKFFVSSVFVKEIVIFQRVDLVSLPNGSGYRLRDLVLPVFPLSSALHGKESVQKPVEQMIVVELLGETFGLLVDAIVRHASLSYKELPDSLSEMKEIQGVVYDEKFSLVPILHVPAVMVHLRRLRSLEFRDRYSPERLEYKNILVVDDGQVSRETLIKILRDAHFDAEGANDGIGAMEILQTRHFHLIVTDDSMPRMDGPTFVENLRKQPEHVHTPVIALVGDQNSEAANQMKERGVSIFLEKANFSRQEFLDQVVVLLGGSL